MPFIMENPNNELMSALATLLEAGKYSDLKVVCRSKEYAVHRAIICSRSGFFDGACRNPFKEAESGVIDLSDDDEEAVGHMINYFYRLDYLSRPLSRRVSQRTGRSRPTSPTSPLTPMSPFTPLSPLNTTMSPLSTMTPLSMRSPLSAQSPMSPRSPRRRRPGKLNLALVEDPLLAQAAASATLNPLTPPDEVATAFDFESLDKMDYSDCEDLEEDDVLLESPIAANETCLDEAHLVQHAKVYALAEKYGITGLKSLARKKFSVQMNQYWSHESFPEAIEEVYESTVETDRGLRDIVIQAFRSHPDLAQRKDVEAAVKVMPQLAWELFKIASGMPIR